MATVTTNNQYYTDIANAIRGKNGTETQYKPSEMAAAIQAISGGGEPEPPDDGKTRLYITVPANAMEGLPPPRNQVPLYIQQTVANGVTIDWGDGTAPETLPGTGNVNTTHTYEQAGDYIISLDPVEGCELGFGTNSSSYCVMGIADTENQAYCNMLKKVIVGNNVTDIGNYAFEYCSNLSKFISNSAISIGDYAFRYCYNLSSFISVGGVTKIGKETFYSCYNLLNFSLDSASSIGKAAFRYCYSLSSVVVKNKISTLEDYTFAYCCGLLNVIIPNNIDSIGTNVFYNCYNVKEYHFLSPTPPALGNTGVFSGIPPDCIIYVPVGSLQAYQTATNWATYADQMQEEPV